jgi:16S rRNA (adenine1518-N6/adenine1519-N6)-dimethyltransferase
MPAFRGKIGQKAARRYAQTSLLCQNGRVQATSSFPARKRWGQHFLLDAAIARRIVESASIGQGETVVEIGPGDGALTRVLIDRARRRLIAIEIDPLRAAALEEELAGDLIVVEGDALSRPIPEWVAPTGLPLPAVVVANLPYNVATPIVSRAMEDRSAVSRIVAMVQREVARRLVARPGSDDYGYLSVRAGLFCRGEILFDVAPGAFRPRPRVVSSVVRLELHEPPLGAAELGRVLSIVSAAFQARRKTLPNALAVLGPRERWAEALERIGLRAATRAEELGVSEFVRLAAAERRLGDA